MNIRRSLVVWTIVVLMIGTPILHPTLGQASACADVLGQVDKSLEDAIQWIIEENTSFARTELGEILAQLASCTDDPDIVASLTEKVTLARGYINQQKLDLALETLTEAKTVTAPYAVPDPTPTIEPGAIAGQGRLVLAFPVGDEYGEGYGLAWSPDGRWLATGGIDGVIELWDAQTGSLVDEFTGHDGYVQILEWSADGSLLMSADEHTVRVWTFDGRSEIWTIILAEDSSINDAALSPDKTHVAIADFYNDEISIWEFETERRVASISTDLPGEIAWSPDGTLLAYDRLSEVHLWDVWADEEVAKNDVLPDLILDLTWSPDGQWLAVGFVDGSISVLRASDARTSSRLPEQIGAPEVLAWSPDSKYLATAYFTLPVRVWDVTTGETVYIFTDAVDWIRGLAYSPNGEQLAAVTIEGQVYIWNVAP